MTFCLAVGKPYLGLVAADTRASGTDGVQEVVIDRDEVSVTNPLGGPALVLPANFRKIRRFRDGWIVATGVVQWVCLAFDALTDPNVTDVDRAATQIRALSKTALPAIDATFPGDTEPRWRSTGLYVVQRDGEAFRCHWIDAEGAAWDGASVNAGLGTKAPVSGLADIMKSYEAEFTDEGYANGFYGMLRATAAAVLAIHDLAGATERISDRVEIGLTRLTRHRRLVSEHLPPTLCRDLLGASDTEIQRLLERV